MLELAGTNDELDVSQLNGELENLYEKMADLEGTHEDIGELELEGSEEYEDENTGKIFRGRKRVRGRGRWKKIRSQISTIQRQIKSLSAKVATKQSIASKSLGNSIQASGGAAAVAAGAAINISVTSNVDIKPRYLTVIGNQPGRFTSLQYNGKTIDEGSTGILPIVLDGTHQYQIPLPVGAGIVVRSTGGTIALIGVNEGAAPGSFTAVVTGDPIRAL